MLTVKERIVLIEQETATDTSAPRRRPEPNKIPAALAQTFSIPALDSLTDAFTPRLPSSPTPSLPKLAPYQSGDLWPHRSELQEVVPNVSITNFFGARNLSQLKANRTTHVLVCADELSEAHPNNFEYLKLEGLADNTSVRLAPHLKRALPWIQETVHERGRVVLHCGAGSSRSGAILVAYIMWSRKMSFTDALHRAHTARPTIDLNPGFREQMIAFQTTGFDLEKIQYLDLR